MTEQIKRAVKLLGNFCISLGGQRLDEIVVEYLAAMLVKMARGEEGCETVAEIMNVHFSVDVHREDVLQLKGILNSKEEVREIVEERPRIKTPQKSLQHSLHGAEFVQEGEEEEEALYKKLNAAKTVQCFDTIRKDSSNESLELLSNLFPDLPVSELEAVYKKNDECFVRTVEMLSIMQAGFEAEPPIATDDGESDMMLFPMEWSKDDFPELPGRHGAGSTNPAQNLKLTFRDVAKKNRPPPAAAEKALPQKSAPSRVYVLRKAMSMNGRETPTIQRRASLGSDGGIPWVATGAAVSKQYEHLRSEAIYCAKVRNTCFHEAALAYVSGNRALAKQLGKEGRKWGEKMKNCHLEASEAIFRSKNPLLRSEKTADNPIVIDLHGLHVAEAKRILTRELQHINDTKPRGRNKITIHIIVGTGHHTKAGAPVFRKHRRQTVVFREHGLHRVYRWL